MPQQIQFNGLNFEVVNAISGNAIATGSTAQDIATVMMKKFAAEHPYYQGNIYNDYYNVVLESAQIAMQTPNTFVPIYNRKNAPSPHLMCKAYNATSP